MNLGYAPCVGDRVCPPEEVCLVKGSGKGKGRASVGRSTDRLPPPHTHTHAGTGTGAAKTHTPASTAHHHQPPSHHARYPYQPSPTIHQQQLQSCADTPLHPRHTHTTTIPAVHGIAQPPSHLLLVQNTPRGTRRITKGILPLHRIPSIVRYHCPPQLSRKQEGQEEVPRSFRSSSRQRRIVVACLTGGLD